MTAADPRALMAMARRHDEAMTDGPWTECCHDQPEDHPCRLIWGAIDGEMVGSLVLDDGRPPKADVAGIAWLRTNLAALLDGYASALDEVERLRALASASPEDLTTVVEQNSALETDNARLREAFSQAIRSLSTDGTVRNAFCSWCDQRWPMLDGESHEVARRYANEHAQQCTAHPLRAELVALRTSLAALRHEVACGRTHNLLEKIDAMIGAP